MALHGEHAVVLGASLSGLLAARVLSDYYGRVTVVERDELPDAAVTRRGVPQGRHAHLLWGAGYHAIEELFPGFVADLDAKGAPRIDGDLSRVFIHTGGHPLPASGRLDGFRLMIPSRPLLDSEVRHRVRALPNVDVRDGHDVVAPVARGDRVVGAVVRPRGGDVDETLDADLVVDAMGRAGRTPALLEEMGYERPAEEGLDVRLTYSSQRVRLPDIAEACIVIGPVPGRPTGVALLRNEDGTAMFTVYGMAGLEPPTDFAGMVAFARGVVPAHVAQALERGEAVGGGSVHRMPATRRRRYDKMTRWPEGLLVIGDAICSFNPIYGQGMTVAALEARALNDTLIVGSHRLAQRYFRAVAKPVGAAWQLATGGDLSLPEVPGPRPLPVRVVNWYVGHIQAASSYDHAVAGPLTRVVALDDPPTALMNPAYVARVAAASLRRRRAA